MRDNTSNQQTQTYTYTKYGTTCPICGEFQEAEFVSVMCQKCKETLTEIILEKREKNENTTFSSTS